MERDPAEHGHLADGWRHPGQGAAVVIMEMADEDEARLWDELAGLTEQRS